MNYLQETLQFIESQEMRDYLLQNPNSLNRYTCCDIVCNAPAPLERKLRVLELVAEQTEYNIERDFWDPIKMADEIRTALNERYDNPSGTVFLVLQQTPSNEAADYRIFTSFDTAIQYIHDYEEVENYPERIDFVWYRIEKWIPGADGKMECYFDWTLNAHGDIWYFGYGDDKFEPEGWADIYDVIGADLNLPVPFQPGDIILADCRPFAKEHYVLILEIGDNRDCCAVQCLYTTKDDDEGNIGTSAFKHNTFLRHPESSPISGLYRATRYHGDLPESDKMLTALSWAIKALLPLT